ncbi:hypothetical protein [Dysosmobacter sp.]|uniref:hypothetical protein n=1 Tax=Dysosmobacter sp. TaxID=2591382 RepID=UPI002A9B4C34|nr:hypothetical protein [Dysosmobacter sp.]MCI6054452.1 hypothetical protein [Dysosmobacter sp.]MDY5509955.1 hypothetical protein [Dysosmobacter sp.]
MDYIREELLRQQALLVILLTGQRTEPLAEEWEVRSDAGEKLLPETAPARRLRQGRSGGADGELPWESALPEAATLWTALADPSAGERAGTAAEKDAGVVRRSAAAWEAPARTTGEIPPEAGEIRLVTEVRRPESGRSADPAALSLAFQRDARRYDGGFRLY